MVRATSHAPRQVPAIGAALVLATVVGCSANRGPLDTTSVVFDGETQAFESTVTCTTQSDGRLVILAVGDDQKTVRVLLSRERQLVVEKVGLHLPGASGFIDDSREVWATKVDGAYTIRGRMPPNAGETTWHQFTVEIACRREVPIPYSPPHSPYLP